MIYFLIKLKYQIFIYFYFKLNKIKNKYFWFLIIYMIFTFDDVFSTETGLELSGIAGPVRCLRISGSSAKIRNKKDRRGSPVAPPMPKSVPSGGREEDQLLMV